ncbi:MAG: phosphoribosylanthranilate isomerase [Candidatus Parvibacillus calidus]|nr:MAG: phosphoribosylanthranilate isomerase [Candidatus Parvibacillus calidus]
MKFPENIREVAQVRPDWMGFIFYPRSPRFIADLSPVDMPESVNTVGVFVNESIAFVREKVQQYNLAAVQLHGHESPDYCAELSGLDIPVWKAFGVDDEFDFQVCLAYSPYCKYFLFDTKSQQFGGSGKVFSWEKLRDYHGDIPFF